MASCSDVIGGCVGDMSPAYAMHTLASEEQNSKFPMSGYDAANIEALLAVVIDAESRVAIHRCHTRDGVADLIFIVAEKNHATEKVRRYPDPG